MARNAPRHIGRLAYPGSGGGAVSSNARVVVVTGAGGFIGSHLVEALVAEGSRVRALVHYNAEGSIGSLRHVDRRTLDAIEIVAGDVRDPYAMRSLVRGAQTDRKSTRLNSSHANIS